MVDVDRRMTALNPAHIAGLRRLSARAAAPSTATIPNTSLLSFSSLAETVVSHLRNSGIRILTGLTEPEFARIEAEFSFTFPPDLRAVLSHGLPVGPGFPNWRDDTSSRAHLRALLHLPIASISSQLTCNSFWPKSWGSRPSDSRKALLIGRNALKKAPILIPLFNHCYIPSTPSLAGNPIFFIDENQIFCCGSELSNFFQCTNPGKIQRSMSEKIVNSSSELTRMSSVSSSARSRTPRWVEFWSEAAVSYRRRNSSSSLSCLSSLTPDRYIEISLIREKVPVWVEKYLNHIGFLLRESCWDESDISDVLCVSSCSLFEEVVLLDDEAVLDSILLRMDRFSDSLRKAGWSCEEVTETLGFEFWLERHNTPMKQLPAEFITRVDSVSRC